MDESVVEQKNVRCFSLSWLKVGFSWSLYIYYFNDSCRSKHLNESTAMCTLALLKQICTIFQREIIANTKQHNMTFVSIFVLPLAILKNIRKWMKRLIHFMFKNSIFMNYFHFNQKNGNKFISFNRRNPEGHVTKAFLRVVAMNLFAK